MGGVAIRPCRLRHAAGERDARIRCRRAERRQLRQRSFPRAIDLARTPEAAQLAGDDADELRIVVAGARSDLGQHEQALAILSTPQLDSTRTGQTAARLFYSYAETLLALGRNQDALQWFINAAAADAEGVTDAEERITDLA